MKRLLDGGVLNYLSKKESITEEDYNKYFCNLDLLYGLNLDSKHFKVIEMFNKLDKKMKNVSIIDANTVSIDGNTIKAKYIRKKSTYEIFFNDEKISIDRQLIDSLCGVHMNVDTVLALTIVYNNIEFLKELDKVKCATTLFKRIKRTDGDLFEYKEYILIHRKDNKVSILEDGDTYLINCNEFNLKMPQQKYHLILEDTVAISYDEEEDTRKLLAGKLLKAKDVNMVDVNCLNTLNVLKESNMKAIPYVLNLNENELELFLRTHKSIIEDEGFSDEDEKQTTLIKSACIKARVGKMLRMKDCVTYKLLEFENFKI